MAEGGDWQRNVLRELAEGAPDPVSPAVPAPAAQAAPAPVTPAVPAPAAQAAPDPVTPAVPAPAAQAAPDPVTPAVPAPSAQAAPDPAAPALPAPAAQAAPEPPQPPAPRQTGDPRVPVHVPESLPTVGPRLALALGGPQHGDSVARRAGGSLRRLTASATREVTEQTRLAQELQQPVTTGRVIAVTSIRGGVGKSTVAALLGRTFNHYRHDPVLTLEADAALGTLPVRMGADTVRWSCADLARILTPSMQLTDVTGYLVPVTDGGWLLPAGQGRVGAPLDVPAYRTVTLALRRYFAVTVVDCETLPGEVARTAMDTAHARVIVAPMTAEGIHGTRQVLDWLARLPHSALATTVVALSANTPDATLDAKAAVAHLREPGVLVVPLPYDRHLAQGGPIHTAMLGRSTRDAAVRLAAEAMRRAVRVR
ncbi:hypothetical protein [Streptomyces sp. P17]|uniref:hypothetical protein n=1 Tax=Streptomyces sp. P17 TaxID=3074716 RepID=UPI0028F408E2|nr:hypothetical protein [Streptomyces sp. P17]MDT9700115.1 hypothetical protein [Streptomyces sp. P17]